MAAALTALLIVLVPALLARPLVSAALSAVGRSWSLPITTVSILTGPVIFLVLFSLWGRVLTGYGWGLLAASLSLAVAGWVLGRRSACRVTSNDRPFLVSFFVLLSVAFLLRINWPALHWENSAQRLGVERLFNLSLQQSFLHSQSWPPNNVWLNGEPVRYHLLLRAAPGIASWFSRVVFDAPLSGGILYLIFDALYLTFAPLAVAAWGFILVSTLAAPFGATSRVTERRCIILSLLVGAHTFFAPHGAAFMAGLRALWSGTTVDFWMIQHEVVKGTVNFFPFGLLLSGESHSYSQAPFLQVCLWGSFMWQLCTPLAVPRAFLTAVLAAALSMAHPGSALLSAFGLTVAVCILLPTTWTTIGWSACLQMVKSVGLTGIFAALLYLPSYLTLNPPETRWVWVTNALASPALDFVPAQAAPLTIAGILLLAGLRVAGIRAWFREHLPVLIALAVAVSLCVVLGRPAIGISLFLAAFVALAVPRATLVAPIGAAFVSGVAMAWITPELIVSDWAVDNRTDWVRFDTVMRFWLDGYYLVPLVVFAACGVKVITTRSRFMLLCSSASFVALLSIVSLYPLLQNRLDRTPEKPSVDGFAFLAAEHPVDWWIIDYLARLSGDVVLGEVCGTGASPLVPFHYGMPGRLSAFSGRPSVCGWGRHTWMFQPVFTRGARNGESVWGSFLSYEQALGVLYSSEDGSQIGRAVASLREQGVTHLAFGELEGHVFGNLDLSRVAERIGGKVVLSPIYGRGVIALAVESNHVVATE